MGIVFENITWDQVTLWSKMLAKMLVDKNSLQMIPLERGGLIIAGIMSHWGCEIIAATELHSSLNCIFVDDIACTGQTVARYQRLRPVAVLVKRYNVKPEPEFWVEEIHHDRYVLFPWQDEAMERKQIETIGFRTKG